MPNSLAPKSGVSDSDKTNRYGLLKASSFHEVNQNFDTVSDVLTVFIGEMKTHSERTNENLTRLAEETSENLTKLATDMKSILSSQTMMFTICIIFVCAMIVVGKSLFDFAMAFMV